VSSPREVDVLDAQAEALRQAQAGAVQQRGDQPEVAVQLVEDPPDLLPGEYDGQPSLLARPDEAVEGADLAAQDVAMQEEERRERLRLGRGADVVLRREVGEEGVDLRLAHRGGMTQAVEADEAPHPEAVGLLGAAAVVARAQGGAQLVDELGHRWIPSREDPSLRPWRVAFNG
jgi:hypothetical protein